MQPGLFQMLLKRLFEDGVKDVSALLNYLAGIPGSWI